MWIHRLTEVNAEARTALCAHCGSVRIQKNGSGWACCRRKNEAKGRLRRGAGYELPIHGTCPLCKESKQLVWDHDHKTGKKRGHICRECNLILGNAKDRPEVLRAAAEYLERTTSAFS